jgi:hypothetical protein
MLILVQDSSDALATQSSNNFYSRFISIVGTYFYFLIYFSSAIFFLLLRYSVCAILMLILLLLFDFYSNCYLFCGIFCCHQDQIKTLRCPMPKGHRGPVSSFASPPFRVGGPGVFLWKTLEFCNAVGEF